MYFSYNSFYSCYSSHHSPLIIIYHPSLLISYHTSLFKLIHHCVLIILHYYLSSIIHHCLSDIIHHYLSILIHPCLLVIIHHYLLLVIITIDKYQSTLFISYHSSQFISHHLSLFITKKQAALLPSIISRINNTTIIILGHFYPLLLALLGQSSAINLI